MEESGARVINTSSDSGVYAIQGSAEQRSKAETLIHEHLARRTVVLFPDNTLGHFFSTKSIWKDRFEKRWGCTLQVVGHNKVSVHAHNQELTKVCVEYLENAFKEGQCTVFDPKGFKNIIIGENGSVIREIMQKTQGLIVNHQNDPLMYVYGSQEEREAVVAEMQHIVENRRVIPCDSHLMNFLFDQKARRLKKLREESGLQNFASDVERTSLSLFGETEACDVAENMLRDLINRVKTKSLSASKDVRKMLISNRGSRVSHFEKKGGAVILISGESEEDEDLEVTVLGESQEEVDKTANLLHNFINSFTIIETEGKLDLVVGFRGNRANNLKRNAQSIEIQWNSEQILLAGDEHELKWVAKEINKRISAIQKVEVGHAAVVVCGEKNSHLNEICYSVGCEIVRGKNDDRESFFISGPPNQVETAKLIIEDIVKTSYMIECSAEAEAVVFMKQRLRMIMEECGVIVGVGDDKNLYIYGGRQELEKAKRAYKDLIERLQEQHAERSEE